MSAIAYNNIEYFKPWLKNPSQARVGLFAKRIEKTIVRRSAVHPQITNTAFFFNFCALERYRNKEIDKVAPTINSNLILPRSSILVFQSINFMETNTPKSKDKKRGGCPKYTLIALEGDSSLPMHFFINLTPTYGHQTRELTDLFH